MRSQRFKDLCFGVAYPITALNGRRHTLRFRRGVPNALRKGPGGELWLNIGSGANPSSYFCNIEGNLLRRPDLWLNLLNGLPFPSESVDGIYAAHVLEHFYWDDLSKIVRESLRVMRSGAVMRVLVPSMELAVEAYVRGDGSWFSDFPRDHASLGGKLSNFLFCDGQHKLAFDFSLARELLLSAGFERVERSVPRDSACFPQSVLASLEPAVHHIETSLVVEAVKA